MSDALHSRFKLLLFGFCGLVIAASAISFIAIYTPNPTALESAIGQALGLEQFHIRLLLAGQLLIVLATGGLAWWGYGCFRDMQAHAEKRMHDLTTAFEFSREMTAKCESEPLFDSVTARAREVMSGSAAALCLLDAEKRAVYLAAGAGECGASPGLCQPISPDFSGRVIHQGETAVSSATCAGCRFLENIPNGQVVATPLRVRDTTLGALCVVRPGTAQFDAEEQNAFALLGNAAAVAMMNVRLMEQSRVQSEETAVHNERARLAAELHDNLAQTLGYLNLKTDRLSLYLSEHDFVQGHHLADAEQELGQVRDAVNQAYLQVRTALTDLHGSVHSGKQPQTLEKRLQACVEELRNTTDMPIALDILDACALDLSSVTQNQVVHIVREAILNAWRHAQASGVRVTVEQIRRRACFTVSDDGQGFDPEQVDCKAHLGLEIMRSRAERSGGSLSIDTYPGKGTRIVATFDLRGERATSATPTQRAIHGTLHGDL